MELSRTYHLGNLKLLKSIKETVRQKFTAVIFIIRTNFGRLLYKVVWYVCGIPQVSSANTTFW